ncbi:radical SAM family heme chaperone HemW [Legionella sp. D16C41]|uniref:radical SAM family heme chaperone HemW n=1 Tax=Legionella sp. D16C41 TaxID=3402688 RepID=UPI003AF73B58
MLPTSLYIHIPWCIRKCPYCDFNSHKSPEILPEEHYIEALIADLKNDLIYFPSREISSIFIGGGTPSLFRAQAYSELFARIQQHLSFAKDIEITLEANPGTVEQSRFQAYKQVGINRLSLGIQSFNSQHLQALGRIHDDKQAHRAIEAARLAGFDNINLDLMYGLPTQTIEQGINDLQQALQYQPEHLSWYQLTIEPNTIFHKKQPTLPNEDVYDLLEQAAFSLLKDHDFIRYEISAFSKKNKMARHNLNYWLFGDYYGIGAGAHGKLTLDLKPTIYRTRKHRQPKDYLKKPHFAAKTEVSQDDLLFEFILNTTRLYQPIANNLFTERTGLAFAKLEVKLKEAQEKGLIILQDNYWQVSELGHRYTNDLQALFLPKIKLAIR